MKDIEPIYRKINSENKHVYIMGDFNIDLLKTDIHRPIHDYVDFIYSFSMLPLFTNQRESQPLQLHVLTIY